MAVQRDSYERLDTRNIVVSDLLSWHFQGIVGEIHRKISGREKFRNPWTISITRNIYWPVFLEFYRAISDYHTSFGRRIVKNKNKKG